MEKRDGSQTHRKNQRLEGNAHVNRELLRGGLWVLLIFLLNILIFPNFPE